MNEYDIEKIGGGIGVYVSPEHTFGTDAFLLSHFATPKRKDIVCDLGTGCGIIPFLWFRNKETRPTKAYGVDIQPQAIDQMNRTKDMSSNLESFHPTLLDLREISGAFPAGSVDVVTCNPPYNIHGAGSFSEKVSAQIARHETMCTTEDYCKAAKWLLRFGGRLCICQLPHRLIDVTTTMREFGIEPKRLRLVQQKCHSTPWLVLLEGKRGAKPGLIIDPPLLLTEEGKTSKEMKIIYGMYGKVD